MSLDPRKLGRFRLPLGMVRAEPWAIIPALEGCAVISARAVVDDDTGNEMIEYAVWHPHLETVPEKKVIPLYRRLDRGGRWEWNTENPRR
jgi:hypothetical protein